MRLAFGLPSRIVNVRSLKTEKPNKCKHFPHTSKHVYLRLEVDTCTNFNLWMVHCPQIVAGAAEVISESVVIVEVTLFLSCFLFGMKSSRSVRFLLPSNFHKQQRT